MDFAFYELLVLSSSQSYFIALYRFHFIKMKLSVKTGTFYSISRNESAKRCRDAQLPQNSTK